MLAVSRNLTRKPMDLTRLCSGNRSGLAVGMRTRCNLVVKQPRGLETPGQEVKMHNQQTMVIDSHGVAITRPSEPLFGSLHLQRAQNRDLRIRGQGDRAVPTKHNRH